MEACLLLVTQATGADQRRVANSVRTIYSLVADHNIDNYAFNLVVTRLLLVFVCRFLVQFRVGIEWRVADQSGESKIERLTNRSTDSGKGRVIRKTVRSLCFFPPFLVFFFLGDDDAVFQKLIFRRGPIDTILPAPLLLQISCTKFTSRGVVLHFMT